MNPRAVLHAFIAENTPTLLRSIELYVLKFGLAQGQAVAPLAQEVLQETVRDALQHADRYDPARQARSWLLGIAVNHIKRKRTERHTRNQREPLLRDMVTDTGQSEEELFEWFTSLQPNGNHQPENGASLEALLAGVATSDQAILRLAFVDELDREAIATELGISSGAARVRLHRAIARLRVAYFQNEEITTHIEEHQANE